MVWIMYVVSIMLGTKYSTEVVGGVGIVGEKWTLVGDHGKEGMEVYVEGPRSFSSDVRLVEGVWRQ